jgi:hypothetical protein
MKRFSEVKLIPRQQITTDPKTFQGRQVKYAQETVNKIVREGFDKSQEPIIVWFDSQINKYIVISGHSRWEASEILFNKGDKSLKNMPAKVFLGDKESAIEYAVLESNRSGTEEGFKSDLKAFKLARNRGFNHEKLLSLFKPESKLKLLQDLSYLNENGKFLSYIGTASEKSFPYIQRNAQWVGSLRKAMPALTNEHESEMFDYLYDSKKNILLTKQKFFDLIQKKVQSIDFNPNKPLNLKNVIAKNAITDPARVKVHQIQTEIDELVRDRSKKEELTVRAKEQGKTDLLNKFKKDIEGINGLILRKMEEKRKLESNITSIERTITNDLFSQPASTKANDMEKRQNYNDFKTEVPPKKAVHPGRTSPKKSIGDGSKKLSEKQKKSLAKGQALMKKAQTLQKSSGTHQIKRYNLPLQKALKQLKKK